MAEDELKSLEAQVAAKEKSLASQVKINKLITESVAAHGKVTEETKNLIAAEKELIALKEKEVELTEKNATAVAKSNKVMQLGSMVLAGMVKAAEKLVDTWELYQTGISNTADGLKLNAGEAEVLFDQFQEIAKSTGDIFSKFPTAQLTAAEISESFGALEQSFGNLSMISPQFAADNALMALKLGISAESSADLQKNFMLMDGMTQSTAQNTSYLLKNLADAHKVNFGSVMDDMAKSGKEFANYMGMSMKDTGMIAVQLRKGGFELQDMMDLAKGLLDIEGRLEKQMMFNAATGKDINLDKVTQLILQEDMIGAQQELLKEVGDTKDLDFLQRGMLDDLLVGKLQQVEMAQELADQADADLEKEQAAIDLMDEKNEKAAEERAKEIERDIQANTHLQEMQKGLENQNIELGKIVGKNNENNETMEMYNNILLAIQATTLGIKLLEIFIGNEKKKKLGTMIVEKGMMAVSFVMRLAEAALGAFVSMVSIPVVGPVLGMAAAASALSWGHSLMSDGVIGPGGETVVSGPKGSIQLDKDDSLIAGTNLGGKGGGSSNGELLAKMDTLISAVRANRQLSVDGYQLNEATHLEKIPSGMA